MRIRELKGPGGDASARVAVDFGCNLFSWTVRGRELLYAPAGFGEDGSYFAGGTPILFPAVGRTWDRSVTPAVAGRYRLRDTGGEYSMPIHGLGPLGRWDEVTAADAGGREDRLVCRFAYDEAVQREHFPFDLQVEQEFRLLASGIVLTARVTNGGDQPAPCAFGYHPYFRLASGRGWVEVPCDRQLELDPDLVVPTGRSRAVTLPVRATAAESLSAVFLGATGGRACLTDRDAGYTIAVEAPAEMTMFVLYSAADAPFVCIEPWTPGLGAYEQLGEEEWRESGALPVVRPAETLVFTVTFTYAESPAGR